jgi:hypothetical protein
MSNTFKPFHCPTQTSKSEPIIADCLAEDRPIAGQKFVCMSFIDPVDILKNKKIFYFERFLKTWEFNKSIEVFVQFLGFAAFKYKLTIDDVMADFHEFVKSEKIELLKSDVEGDYKTFVEQNYKSLDEEFSVLHKFQTHTSGVKVRGVYATLEEAQLRGKTLRDIDVAHSVHVCPVGMWAPIAPKAYETGEVDHLIPELNELMHEKEKNDATAKAEFDKRILDTRRAAMEENAKISKKSGNMLTQTIDEHGNLTGLGKTSQEASFGTNGDDVSTETIQKTLFEGANIVDGDSDHGKSKVLNQKLFE